MASNKKRVLVVDDDCELLRLVGVLLSRSNIAVVTADSAGAAGHLLRTGVPVDLLILDLMLPDISGIEFLRQIRANPVYDDLPVLILSALIDPERIRTALDSGADRYLTKPYIANNLLTIVQDVLRVGRRRD